MYCHNCGNEIPGNSKFCPECGANLQAYSSDNYSEPSGVGVLKIGRKNSDMAMMVKTKIYIDGNLCGEVGNGKAASFQLDEGYHVVELKTPGNNGIMRNIAIDSDTETRFIFTLTMSAEGFHKVISILNVNPNEYDEPPAREVPQARNLPQVQPEPKPTVNRQKRKPGTRCPRCGGRMTMQMVTESRKSGCGTILLYVILALTVFGLLIVIPLALRRKTETVTYSVCEDCGFKRLVSRT